MPVCLVRDSAIDVVDLAEEMARERIQRRGLALEAEDDDDG